MADKLEAVEDIVEAEEADKPKKAVLVVEMKHELKGDLEYAAATTQRSISSLVRYLIADFVEGLREEEEMKAARRAQKLKKLGVTVAAA